MKGPLRSHPAERYATPIAEISHLFLPFLPDDGSYNGRISSASSSSKVNSIESGIGSCALAIVRVVTVLFGLVVRVLVFGVVLIVVIVCGSLIFVSTDR